MKTLRFVPWWPDCVPCQQLHAWQRRKRGEGRGGALVRWLCFEEQHDIHDGRCLVWEALYKICLVPVVIAVNVILLTSCHNDNKFNRHHRHNHHLNWLSPKPSWPCSLAPKTRNEPDWLRDVKLQLSNLWVLKLTRGDVFCAQMQHIHINIHIYIYMHIYME